MDQSDDSTPGALESNGVPPSDYDGDAAMFDRVQQMGTRIVTDPAFDDRVIAAILFEDTARRRVECLRPLRCLRRRKRVAPLLKIDQGLADGSGERLD